MAELTITPKRRNKLYDKVPDKISYLKSETRERRLNLLYLINSYLIDQNLLQTSEAFEKECQLSGEYRVCENIDLEIIFQEFQSYYYTKFQKYPKILKKNSGSHIETVKKVRSTTNSGKMKSRTSANMIEKSNLPEKEDFHFQIISCPSSLSTDEKELPKLMPEKLIRDIGDFSTEWKEMANMIMKECFMRNFDVKWKNCIGLEHSIEKLKEAMVYPLNYPSIFKNVDSWRGVLLFGPPGTGKTLLAKALASEQSTFINVSSSVFVSKWRGESEKMIKILFDLAKYYAPTTIFIDEIESLIFATDFQHDASKRFRSEFLTQVDGILGNNENIFLLGSTNLPWNLDAAILRRFEKRLFISLPNKDARLKLLKHYLPHPNNLQDQEFEYLASQTDNFSGSDMKNLCKEAAMCSVREKICELKSKTKLHPNEQLRSITYGDVEQAFLKMKPCVNNCTKYIEWNEKYGAF